MDMWAQAEEEGWGQEVEELVSIYSPLCVEIVAVKGPAPCLRASVVCSTGILKRVGWREGAIALERDSRS